MHYWNLRPKYRKPKTLFKIQTVFGALKKKLNHVKKFQLQSFQNTILLKIFHIFRYFWLALIAIFINGFDFFRNKINYNYVAKITKNLKCTLKMTTFSDKHKKCFFFLRILSKYMKKVLHLFFLYNLFIQNNVVEKIF